MLCAFSKQILWRVNIDVRCKNVRALVVSCYEEHMARFSDLETVMITVLYQHSQYSHTTIYIVYQHSQHSHTTICRVIYIVSIVTVQYVASSTFRTWPLTLIGYWIGLVWTLNIPTLWEMLYSTLYISSDAMIIIHDTRILGQWQQHYSSHERAGKNNNCRYCLYVCL